MKRTPLKVCLFFYYFIIFQDLCSFVVSKALVGEDIKRTGDGQFPFIVSLMDTRNGRLLQGVLGIHFCTGTLITNKDVLTCDHCLEQRDKSNVVVMAESTDLRHTRKYIPRTWITYNQWATVRSVPLEFQKNDLAIIKLIDSVPSTPAVLSYTKSVYLYGETVTVAGWGQIRSLEIPVYMRWAYLKVLTRNECQHRLSTAHGSAIPLSSRLLCSTAQPYAIVTLGDSGGPLIYQDKVIGVNSGTCLHQNEIFHPGKINLHINIEYYKNFIEEIRNSN